MSFCIAAACSSDSGTEGEITGVVLSSSSFSIGVGASTQLLLYAQFSGGAAPRTDGIAWATSDMSIATVDAQGTVRGLALGGPATITATRGGRSAQATVLVIPASVEITPRVSTLQVGASLQMTATALDHSGAPLAAQTPVWSISFTSGNQVASITPEGRLTILAPGVVVVEAVMSGQQGLHQVSVPSAFDGVWSGTAATGSAVDFVVQFGVVSSFRLPNTLRQACSRQVLNLQTGVIAADNRFALGLPGLPSLVSGVFTSPTGMNGAYGEIPAIEGCSGGTEGPVPAAAFTAARQ
jgi:hypothetical protein